MLPKPRDDDEAFFQEALDATAGDASLRWLFADWLAERGDWRAAGYGWMARHEKAPMLEDVQYATGPRWRWWTMQPGWKGHVGAVNNEPDRLSEKIFETLDGAAYKSLRSGQCAYCEFYTRRDAEEALCRALFKLTLAAREAR